MQYYDMETIADPAPREALAIREISAGAAEMLAKDAAPPLPPSVYRVIASHNGDRPRLIVDVDLSGTVLPIDLAG